MTEKVVLTLLTASGFIISPIMALFSAWIIETIKNRQEVKKAVLNKKMEAAENFLNEFSKYLDAIYLLAGALRIKDSSRGDKSREFLATVIRSSEDTFKGFSQHTIHVTKAILYFKLDESFTSDRELQTHLGFTVRHKDFTEKYEKTDDPTFLEKADNELLAMCDWLDSQADAKKRLFDRIRDDIWKSLKL